MTLREEFEKIPHAKQIKLIEACTIKKQLLSYQALLYFPSNGLVVKFDHLATVKVLNEEAENLPEISNVLGEIALLASQFGLVYFSFTDNRAMQSHNILHEPI